MFPNSSRLQLVMWLTFVHVLARLAEEDEVLFSDCQCLCI